MNRIEAERVVRDACQLLRGGTPRGELSDPSLIADLIVHHGLGPLGSWQASRHDTWRRKLAGEPLQRLDQTVLQAKIRRNMVVVALADALKILRPFHPVLFKGLALAELYPRPWLRNPGDLDILLGTGDFDKAVEALQGEGWRLQPSIHRDHPAEIGRKYGFAQVLRHPVRPVIVDLHRDPIDRTEPFWLHPDALTQQTSRLELTEGLALSTLQPIQHLAYTALHSVRHGTFRLAWSYDVHLGCELWRQQIDPREFETFCRHWNILRGVHVGLEVARQLYATSWHPLDHLIPDKATARAAARRSPYVIGHGHLTQHGGWRRLSAMLDLMDHNRDKAGYLFRTMFPSRDLFWFSDTDRPGWGAYLQDRFRAAGKLIQGFRDGPKKRAE
ncbi:nucleotidyltransferase family protein [bacterium]|nr:nucleotidyltransferase family protein [bacterium]